jgi:hypothetical protein
MTKRAEVFFLVLVLSACAGASPFPSRAGPKSTREPSPVTPDRTSIGRGGEPNLAAVAILDDGSGDGGPPDPQPPIDVDV